MLLRALLGKPETRADNFVLPGPGLFNQPLTGPLNVNDGTSLSVPAAYRAVQVLSDAIATLPLKAVRNGQVIADTPQLLRRPDPQESRIDTVAALVTSLLMHGNAYALIGNRDRLGFATSLTVLAPPAVSVMQEAGAVVYKVGGQSFDSSEIMHIRGLTLPGSLTGLGPLAVQRRSLGLAIAGEEYSSELFVGGSMPSGVLHVEGELNKTEAEALKNGFVAAHGGRQRTPAVLSGGVKYDALGWSSADLELLESRKYNAQAIATIFGVPGHLIGIAQSDSMTYSNVQQDSISFVRWSIQPWASRVEAALTELLPRGQEAKFNMGGLMRADMQTRYQAHAVALSSGFMTVDEVRALEDLEALDAPPVVDVVDVVEDAEDE
jgi:HK97 family phage portal protein